MVDIASPNSLHFPQTRLFLSHKKHVICEKPLASNLQEVEAAIALAKENNVVLFEAFKTASLPNFLLLKKRSLKWANYAKPLSTTVSTPRAISATLTAKTPTPLTRRSLTVRLWISASIAWRPLWRCGASDGPSLATASLLDSGVDAQGTVVLSYGDFDVERRITPKLAIP